jgi:hypothetical protein
MPAPRRAAHLDDFGSSVHDAVRQHRHAQRSSLRRAEGRE